MDAQQIVALVLIGIVAFVAGMAVQGALFLLASRMRGDYDAGYVMGFEMGREERDA